MLINVHFTSHESLYESESSCLFSEIDESCFSLIHLHSGPRLALRSASSWCYEVPRTTLKFDERAFSFACPCESNSLPAALQKHPNTNTFKNSLEHSFPSTYLFWFILISQFLGNFILIYLHVMRRWLYWCKRRTRNDTFVFVNFAALSLVCCYSFRLSQRCFILLAELMELF